MSHHFWIVFNLHTNRKGVLMMQWLVFDIVYFNTWTSLEIMPDFFFIDFSSAFNSIQHHQVIKKLQYLQVPSPLIHWIYNFVSNRPQVIKVDNALSPTIVLNTGAPQGYVLSPLQMTVRVQFCSYSYCTQALNT